MQDWLFVGLVAGLLTTIGFVPQIVKSLRTRRMDEVSFLMPLLLSAGMLLWLIYGLIKGDPAIILWNAIALALNTGLVGLKVHYSRSGTRNA
ncbi:MAG: SemiSWEET transporter [Methanomassiliicoccus sp.]|nr:SemiSWEET transporter [Methanomassiliicoccus sp.]